MKVPRPDSLNDSTDTAQGAVPFGYGSAPSSAGPEHHSNGAVDAEVPGKSPVDFASVAPPKHPARPDRATNAVKPTDSDGSPAWLA